MNLTRGINLRKIAEKMTGSSGAEVKVSPSDYIHLSLYFDIIARKLMLYLLADIIIGCLHGSWYVCS